MNGKVSLSRRGGGSSGQCKGLKLVAALFVGLAITSGGAHAAFTGPSGYYYIDNINSKTIYVVHGTQVVKQFAWNYGTSTYAEGNLAIANGKVSTTDFGSYSMVTSPRPRAANTG